MIKNNLILGTGVLIFNNDKGTAQGYFKLKNNLILGTGVLILRLIRGRLFQTQHGKE